MAQPIIDQLRAPQWIDDTCSALCTIGRPQYVLSGALLWILRYHFAQASNIVDKDLKEYIWTSAVETSKITIEPVTKWNGPNTQAVQSRPAIYVKRNTYGKMKLGIGDKYQLGSNTRVDNSNPVRNNTFDTGTSYGAVIAGSHTIFCLSATGADAEAVGTEVFYELLEFSPLIRRDLDLHKFEVMEVGSIAKLEESNEHWLVPVTVNYMFAHDWVLSKDALPLKSMSLSSV
jgi:hypothetical protein